MSKRSNSINTQPFDLRAMDANTALAGDLTFIFSGPTAKANSVWYADIGAATMLHGVTNGNGVADFEIQVMGVNSIAEGELLL